MKKKFFVKEEEKINDGFSYSSCYFPYFPSRADIIDPLGMITLAQFLKAHKEPKQSTLETFKAIEEATERGDKKTKDKIKQTKLTYFTPSTCLTKRNYESITCFTGIIVMEYDKLGYEKANKLKNQIFKRFKSCICAYFSPSRTGCKFLFRTMKVNSVEEYKEYFYGLASYLEQIEGFDSSSKSPVLPLFLSYDKDMLIRDESELETWVLKGTYPTSIDNREFSDVKVENVSEEDLRHIYAIIDKRFKKIDEQQAGHNLVITTSLLCGGWVGAGYISEQEIVDYLTDKITNSVYCAGRSDYYKTMRRFVSDGILRPLLLQKD